jgi:branched-chain amino acid transport system permease protein
VTLALITGRRGLIAGAILFAIGLALPFVPGVYTGFAIELLCFALVAVAFDLLLGFTGLLSFGHALFWGGSGYVATILIGREGWTSFPAALLAGVAYAFVVSLVVGALTVRRSGIYFAMVTLAIAEIQYFMAYQFADLTGGENGTQIPTRGSFFGPWLDSHIGLSLESDRVYYYVVLAIVALCVMFAIRVVSSPFGAVLAAMRENEQRARSIGYDTNRFKLAAFVMSGTLAGLAGALFAIGNRLSGLDGVDWHTSGAIVMMTILGGIGTIFGPIVGAGLFESLEYFVSKTALGDKTNLVMGVVFAVVILVARRGIVGEILHRSFARKRRLVEDEDNPDRLVAEPALGAEERRH